MFKGGGMQNNYNKINTLLNYKKLKSLRKKGFLTGFLLLLGGVFLFKYKGTEYVKGTYYWYTTHTEQLTIWGWISIFMFIASGIFFAIAVFALVRLASGKICPKCSVVVSKCVFYCPVCKMRFDGKKDVEINISHAINNFDQQSFTQSSQLNFQVNRYCSFCGNLLEKESCFCGSCGNKQK